MVRGRKSWHFLELLNNADEVSPSVGNRSVSARRFHHITNAITADQGGADQCSESRRQLIRRFGASAVLAEQMELRLVNGEEISIEQYALICGTLTRLASMLGIDRRQRDVTPSLVDILKNEP